MATAYPGALDTVGSQLRTDIASTDDLDASGKQHDVMHVNVHGATVALETKLGIGASAASGASDGDALTKQADGSTAWEAVPSGVSWSGSTADGLASYGSSSSVVAESTATYASDTLTLTGSGGGLKMDGLNSSDANTLDDYEEGLWTAAITAASGTITVHGTNKIGSYIKIGQIVHIQGAIGVSAISSPSGALNMTGLPFTPHNSLTGDADRAFLAGGIAEPTAQTLGIFGRIVDGTAAINYRGGIGETSEDSSIADVIDTSSQFYISGSYRAAT